jgi:hypothetical protein
MWDEFAACTNYFRFNDGAGRSLQSGFYTWGDFSMHAKSLVLAAILAGLAGAGNQALAQYGPSPYGPGGYAPGGYGPGAPGMMPGMPGSPMMGAMQAGMMGPPPGMMGGGMPPGMMGGGVMPAGYGAGYGGPTQAMGCTDSPQGGCSTCCSPCGDCGWCNHWSVFGEFLYLRPRDAEVAYAVAIDGNITDPSDPAFPVGPVQVVDPNYQPGFRAGFGFTLDPCSMVQVSYSQLDADANDSLVVSGGTGPVARSLVSPLPINAAVDTLDAEAHQAIQFKMFDVDYKGIITCSDVHRLNYVLGVRYAKLSQEFDAIFETNGFDTVETDVDFEGAGIKMGLEGERYSCNRCWFVYGKGDVAFLGGESRASYFGSNNADAIVVDTAWEAGRLVTITDLEAGMGWQNSCGNLRLSAGYMFSVWYNITRTNEWIHAVQQNNYTDPSDNFYGMMSFDGITAKIEFLW